MIFNIIKKKEEEISSAPLTEGSTSTQPVGGHGGRVEVGSLPFMFRSSMLLLAGLLSVAVVLCRATPHGTQSETLPRISQRQTPTLERVFVDSFNRQRIFHGTNAVVKGPPWIPDSRPLR